VLVSAVVEALRAPVLLGATIAAGLQAGTYYTWACAVMPGLARVDDRAFVTAMQQMNTAIVNPVFMLTFLGAPALAALAGATSTSTARTWVIAGLAFAVTTVVVTAVGDIPLNHALEAAGPVDTIPDLAAVRAGFEDSWVRWNLLRAVTSTASLASLAWASWRS
jgi:uncharacterized membrane protein